MLVINERAVAMQNKPNTKLRIFISGVDSTPDPYPGVGIARSLRSAFPACELVAVDWSQQSSGLNSPDFDEWLLLSNRRDLARLCANLAPMNTLSLAQTMRFTGSLAICASANVF